MLSRSNKISRTVKQIEYSTLPTKRDLLSKIKDNDSILGIVSRKDPSYQKGDSLYVIAVDRTSARVSELAVSKFMKSKYKKDVGVYEESMVERPWVTHAVAFYSYDALYEFMKALLTMNQKDANSLLSDMLFDFGYSEVTGWF